MDADPYMFLSMIHGDRSRVELEGIIPWYYNYLEKPLKYRRSFATVLLCRVMLM